MLGNQSVMVGSRCRPTRRRSSARAIGRREPSRCLAKNKSGVGIGVYVAVPDIDQFHARS
jgi:hypothetical protein